MAKIWFSYRGSLSILLLNKAVLLFLLASEETIEPLDVFFDVVLPWSVDLLQCFCVELNPWSPDAFNLFLLGFTFFTRSSMHLASDRDLKDSDFPSKYLDSPLLQICQFHQPH